MDRRGFLGAILAAAAAPAIVRASSLMKLAPGLEIAESGLVVPVTEIYARNQVLAIKQITDATSALLARYRVMDVGGWPNGEFRVGDIITIGG
jgi:hypothetical protein